MVSTFGEQIAKARASYRLSQLAVAKTIGRSQFWLSYAERGKFPLAKPVAQKILLAIHRLGQDRLAALNVLKAPIPSSEQGKFHLGPPSSAPEEGRTFFCNPRTVNELRLLRDTLGRPLLWTNPADKLDMRLNGYPVFTSTQIPLTQTRGSGTTCSYLLLAAMSDIYVGQGVKSQGLEVAISDQALFANAEILVRLLYRTDIQPGHALSVAILSCIL